MPSLNSALSRLVPHGRARYVVAAVAGLAVIGLVVGLLVSGNSSTPTPQAAPTTTAPTTTTSSTLPYLGAYHCPLTDLPAPAGAPLRPAVAVKVGNEPFGARPQSGLGEADVVYDTPAEGFIMRFIAVFQCNEAAQIGPDRSVRWVDQRLVRMLQEPILAFAGGINPNVDAVMRTSWIHPANLLGGGAAAGHRTTNRQPPDNLYTSTAALWAMYPKAKVPPWPIFRFTPALPAGAKPASSLAIDFSYDTDVVWKWNPSTNSWIHTYSGQTDVDALSGEPVTASNVVVEVVHYHLGRYAESRGGSGDIQSQTLGSGLGYVLRNGKVIKVTWHRKDQVNPTTFTSADGTEVGLTPGRTFVEIVPDRTFTTPGAVRITP